MRLRLSALCLLTVFLVGPRAAEAFDPASSRTYRLGGSSSFQTGCFDPCDCATLDPAPLRGVFRLSPLGFGGVTDVYAIDQLSWTTMFNGEELHVTGGGLYRVTMEGPSLVQQVELELRVGNGEIQHFDSGPVPIAAAFPKLDVTLSLHGMVCNDTVLHVDAAPVRPRDVRRYRLVEPSTFQEGCVAPCLCPTGPELPLRGRFRLVSLVDEPPFQRFAVIGVRWRVTDGFPGETVYHIRGSGRYTRFSEFAVMQDLSLDLSIGGREPLGFDSGLVLGGSELPRRIDVGIVNATACFERRIDLHGVRIPRRRQS